MAVVVGHPSDVAAVLWVLLSTVSPGASCVISVVPGPVSSSAGGTATPIAAATAAATGATLDVLSCHDRGVHKIHIEGEKALRVLIAAYGGRLPKWFEPSQNGRKAAIKMYFTCYDEREVHLFAELRRVTTSIRHRVGTVVVMIFVGASYKLVLIHLEGGKGGGGEASHPIVPYRSHQCPLNKQITMNKDTTHTELLHFKRYFRNMAVAR